MINRYLPESINRIKIGTKIDACIKTEFINTKQNTKNTKSSKSNKTDNTHFNMHA
jgi:hypothetical protein